MQANLSHASISIFYWFPINFFTVAVQCREIIIKALLLLITMIILSVMAHLFESKLCFQSTGNSDCGVTACSFPWSTDPPNMTKSKGDSNFILHTNGKQILPSFFPIHCKKFEIAWIPFYSEEIHEMLTVPTNDIDFGQNQNIEVNLDLHQFFSTPLIFLLVKRETSISHDTTRFVFKYFAKLSVIPHYSVLLL
jgi:hypothetical protein